MTAVMRKQFKMGVSGDGAEVWNNLKQDDVGDPCELSQSAALHIQALGEFGPASVVMQGSNVEQPEEADWSDLVDTLGLPLTFQSGAPLKRADTVPCRVRPFVRGGDETTDVRVLMLIRKIS